MSKIECKICGGGLELPEGVTSGECPYCGTLTTFPKIADGQQEQLYSRAEQFRRSGDFDNAVSCYEELVQIMPDDPEVYWGLMLSRRGIVYDEDPVSHKRIPTFRRAQQMSILSDPYYRCVLDLASEYNRALYEQQAARIAEFQKRSSQETPQKAAAVPEDTPDPRAAKEAPPASSAEFPSFSIETDNPLLIRVQLFLETGDFSSAEKYCERVLGKDPKNAYAYFYRLMAERKICDARKLLQVKQLAKKRNFVLARRYADPELAEKLDVLLREAQKTSLKKTKKGAPLGVGMAAAISPWLRRHRRAVALCLMILVAGVAGWFVFYQRLSIDKIAREQGLTIERGDGGMYIVTAYTGTGGSVKIPNGVGKIGEAAFKDCAVLNSVTIPVSVKEIGECAFQGCADLSSVTISEGVKEIGKIAFAECQNLTSVTIPGSVKKIGEGAFQDCIRLAHVLISDGVEEIGKVAFVGCRNLTSVTIPGSVKKIGENVFQECSSLTSATIANGVEEIGKGTFAGCENLTQVTISGSVKGIGRGAFANCIRLSDVTIPESVRIVGEKAFIDCKRLKSVNIPNGVKEIGSAAFQGCSRLTSVTIPGSVKKIGEHVFQDCSSLTSATIANGVEEISRAAFGLCVNLARITIPGSVKKIGRAAFAYCNNLTSVTISGSVKEIGKVAFAFCPRLTRVTIPKHTEVASDAFDSHVRIIRR